MGKTVGIVGYGAVGKGVHSLFPDAAVYDEPLGIGERDDINGCDVVFVSVPTPMGEDGSCDTSIVESVVSWIEAGVIVLRSTVAVGTTDRLRQQLGKRVVFQPEYGPGETVGHHFANVGDVDWVVLGGAREDTVVVVDLYKEAFNAELRIQQTDARTAELTKYMENAYLAVKVAFCNELYDIAERFGTDYNELRELWLMDPRIGRSHTFVFPENRGFGGKCLPKDISALVRSAENEGYDPMLLRATIQANDQLRRRERGEV